MRFPIVALLALVATPAFAQCPESAVQDAVNAWVVASKAGDSSAEGEKVDALAAACPKNAYVLKVVALTHGVLARKASKPENMLEHAEKARAFAMTMRNVQPADELELSAVIGLNLVPIRIYADNFDHDILLTLIAAQQKSGLFGSESQPVKPGEQMRECRTWDVVDAQIISDIIRDNLKSNLTGPLNMLDRLIAVCESSIAQGQDAIMLAMRARALYQLLANNPEREGNRAMIQKLQDDSRRFFELRPNGDPVYWSAEDRDRLQTLMLEFDLATGNVPPRGDWFKLGNVEDSRVIRSIALALDDAWAADETGDAAGKYETYRGLIETLVFEEAARSETPAIAKRAIALAAKGQADGSMRRTENKQRSTPPDFLWSWVDPEVLPN